MIYLKTDIYLEIIMVQAIKALSNSKDKFNVNNKCYSHLIKKNESWTRFFVKVTLLLTALILTGLAFTSRYIIVVDPQQVRCITGYIIYLVDKKDIELQRGRLYMFLSKDLTPIYDEGTKMLKYLRALPGDVVEIEQKEQIIINGKVIERGLSLAQEKLGQPASNFQGKTTLVGDQYWFLGTSSKSFDSRYWGAVKRESIIGRAYPLI
jgi:conjugal transfer pilin signal peptidase TrbI